MSEKNKKAEENKDKKKENGENEEKNKAAEDFKNFVKQTSTALSLGVAVVGANAVSQFVNSFVSGLVTPAIDLILPKGDYENLVYEVNGSEFLVGNFISATINMIIISIIIYIYARYITKDDKILEKAKVK
jgi:large conductance mechanosensitive channel